MFFSYCRVFVGWLGDRPVDEQDYIIDVFFPIVGCLLGGWGIDLG